MLKKVLIAIAALIVLLVLIAFVLPSKVEVTESTSINAPVESIFEEVNNLENWTHWSPWYAMEPNMEITYGDKKEGSGASYSWKGDKMGEGSLTITESVPNQSIAINLNFMEQGTAKGYYLFEPEGEATKVSWNFESELGMNPLARWFGLFMPGMLRKDFQTGLAKLKEVSEAKPKFSVELSELEVQPVYFIGISHTMSPQDPNAISMQMGKMYGELMGALQKSKVEMTGYPFCLYPQYSEESMEMVCALPVAADAKLPVKYKIQQTTGGKAVKGIHTGAYDKLEDTHNQINQYIEYKKLEISGAPWEVYITDPGTEPDTAKWITEIYYPVKD